VPFRVKLETDPAEARRSILQRRASSYARPGRCLRVEGHARAQTDAHAAWIARHRLSSATQRCASVVVHNSTGRWSGSYRLPTGWTPPNGAVCGPSLSAHDSARTKRGGTARPRSRHHPSRQPHEAALQCDAKWLGVDDEDAIHTRAANRSAEVHIAMPLWRRRVW
jgi:hypothetical protein